jgi:hypothetical protein
MKHLAFDRYMSASLGLPLNIYWSKGDYRYLKEFWDAELNKGEDSCFSATATAKRAVTSIPLRVLWDGKHHHDRRSVGPSFIV